jgi:hypothetical protein
LGLVLSWASDVWDRYRGISPLDAHEDYPAVLEINSHRARWAIAGWDRAAGGVGAERTVSAPALSKSDEVSRRAVLLADYRIASGVSEYFIYTYARSGIHKPQFRQWKNGTLSADSATTKNFERFLLEKVVPPPRREKR